MGLRMWKDPDEEAIIEDVAVKLDRAAAARRSPIRREPSLRPGRDHVPPQSISLFLRNRHQNMLRTRDRLRQEESETDSQIAQLQGELERLRRLRLRNRIRLNDEFEAPRAGRDSLDSNEPEDQLSPDENNGSTAEDTLDTTRSSLPRPPRESNLRFELLPSTTSRSTSPWRYQVLARTSMPSPPRSAGSERRDPSIPDGPIPGESWLTDPQNMPALTEGFAPAQVPADGSSQQQDGQRLGDEFQGLDTPPPETWESTYPPLQRVGHNSPRPVPRVDGLGDRRRSLSPFSDHPADHNEEETWMSNLLTTIDPSRSSSATSFTSHNGTRRSNNSSQTTSTSFGEIGSTDDTCELDLPEGITDDDVRAIRASHSNLRRRLDRNIMMGLAGMREPADADQDNAYYAMFQAILERMQRREPIPQDWWNTVSLPSDTERRRRDL